MAGWIDIHPALTLHELKSGKANVFPLFYLAEQVHCLQGSDLVGPEKR
jgi:hypothetical protein